jgi:hypothetical protein
VYWRLKTMRNVTTEAIAEGQSSHALLQRSMKPATSHPRTSFRGRCA